MKDEKNKETGSSSKKSWDELVFTAIEKIAAAPGKLKDPKESVKEAFDWAKTIRDDVQQKILADVSQRLAQIDWESMMKKVGEHLAEKYDLQVEAKVSFKPKNQSASTENNENEFSEKREEPPEV